MDFRLTEEQLMLQRMVREFAQKEVKPLSLILDARTNPQDCISWELVKKASELGIRTLAIPEKWGGAGADLLTRLIVQEELGAADVGFADVMRDHGSRLNKLNAEQKEEFIPKYMADDTFLTAGANTEPNHGTDQFMTDNNLRASLQTFAEKKGDEYIINGTKQFISCGSIAKLYFVRARTDRMQPFSQSEKVFLVPADIHGFSVGRVHNKLGRRLLISAELVFEDVHIPARYLITNKEVGWGEGEREARPGTAEAGLIIYSGIVGLLRCCYEETLAYARSRIQGGKPIIEHPTVAMKLARMKFQIEAARTTLHKCAWSWDNKYHYDPKMYLLIKGFINEISVDIVSKAADIHGGMGTEKSLPIEKYIRDAYTTLHGLGTGEMAYIRGAPGLNP